MVKRILFILVYIILFPLFILATIMAFLGMFIAPFVWIITGDEERAWKVVFGMGQDWLISLPYKIFRENDIL
jgi:hypothetical protein